MTVYTRTVHDLWCNGRNPYPTADDPGNMIGCLKSYEPPDDPDRGVLTPALLRKLAAKDGWTRVRSTLGRRFDRDFCPDHKPEGTTR